MKLKVYNDGKEKRQSFEASIDISEIDLECYGASERESVEKLLVKLDSFINKITLMRYELVEKLKENTHKDKLMTVESLKKECEILIDKGYSDTIVTVDGLYLTKDYLINKTPEVSQDGYKVIDL